MCDGYNGIDDNRQDKSHPMGWVCMTDRFLSGWGLAGGGRSLYCIAVHSSDEADIVEDNALRRTDMMRVRFQRNLPGLRDGDHMSIVDRGCASRWYEPNGFQGKTGV